MMAMMMMTVIVVMLMIIVVVVMVVTIAMVLLCTVIYNMQVIISMQPLCFDFHFNFQKGAFVFLELSWILFWRAAWCQYIKGRNGMNS